MDRVPTPREQYEGQGLLAYGLKGIQGVYPFCKKYIYPWEHYQEKCLTRLDK